MVTTVGSDFLQDRVLGLPEKTSDELLLKRAGNGEQAAFLELYERHREPVFRFAYRLLGTVELAEDITHDCFLSLIRKPGNFRAERGSLRTYLFAAARNLALKHFRGSAREASLDELEIEPDTGTEQPLRQVLSEELTALVKEAVLALPPLQREALVLFEYEGLSLNEIAKITESDVGAIKGRLFRARERMKTMLRPYLDVNQELNHSREIVTLREA
ncbi:MAG TPA: RNA polymerase sigma factor [Pyrinomonadaceae bacterium]|jgi:RNA polymerase sigma-70 factor, ECF subfamily